MNITDIKPSVKKNQERKIQNEGKCRKDEFASCKERNVVEELM